MTDETKKEPTTAEAFATVREALALLERRVGTMTVGLRELTADHNDGQRCICSGCTVLADAQFVFTLEEVEVAFFRAVMDGDDPGNEDIIRAVLRGLSALRSTGGER